MSVSREQIMTAVFNLLKSVPGFTTTSRRVRHWSEVTQQEQPALFLAQGKELLAPSKMGTPVPHTIQALVYVYAHTQGDPTLGPSQVINPLVDAIEAAFPAQAAGNKQTLGGLVVHAALSGSIETDEGALGDQGVAIVPLEILYVQ